MTTCNPGRRLWLRTTRLAAVGLVVACAFAARPAPAQANILGPVCGVIGVLSGLLGKGCDVVASNPGRIISAAKDLFGGHISSAIKAILGDAGSSLKAHAGTIVGLAAIGLWVIGGAKFAVHELAHVLGETTTPRLGTSWFSAAYWRMAAIAALLTLPFLFAAAIQALVHSDLTLLLRSALGYLPLAVLVVAVAAPLTMLLLSASDELSSLVSSASGQAGSHAFGLGAAFVGSVSTFSGSLFFACFFGLLMVLGATALWIELVMREAAVYVVVLMLPLAFAALVWPARRRWAIRAVEVLMALILSKFVIVAVLSLGGAAMDQLGHSVTTPIVGLVLVMMGAFAPWAMLRLVPLAELASATVGSLRGEAQVPVAETARAFDLARSADQWGAAATQSMSATADQALLLPGSGSDDGDDGEATDSSPGDIDPGPEGPGGDGVALDPEADLQEPPETELQGAAATSSQATLDREPAQIAGVSPGASAANSQPGGLGSATPRELGDAGHASGAPDAREPRIPGLPPMWQADNFAWRPLVLGPHEDGPPTLWPPEGAAGGLEANSGLLDDEAHLLPTGHDALADAPDLASPAAAQPPASLATAAEPGTRPALPAPAPPPEEPEAVDPPRTSDPPVPPERPAGPGALPPPPPHEPEPSR